MPIFLDEVPAENITAGQELCGTDAASIPCLFDFIATLDAELAGSTNSSVTEALTSIAEAGKKLTLLLLLLTPCHCLFCPKLKYSMEEFETSYSGGTQ